MYVPGIKTAKVWIVWGDNTETLLKPADFEKVYMKMILLPLRFVIPPP